MKFYEKGWIARYLHLRNQYALHKEFDKLLSAATATPLGADEENAQQHPETFLYELLQPTGLMYGYPATLPLENKSLVRALRLDATPQADKTKVILLESFLRSALTSSRYQSMENAVDMADALLDAALLIGKFYQSVYQGWETRQRRWFYYRQRRGLELSEFVLESKLNKESHIGNFWFEFFNTSLMFLDVYYFGQWVHAEKTIDENNRMAETHEAMRLLIFKIIAAAAMANDTIEPEEKNLLKYFTKAAMFSARAQSFCEQYLESPEPLSQLNLYPIGSRILKKYTFELALLVVYADKLLNRGEKKFIVLLSKKLGLGKEEVSSSLLSVESFIVSHWQQMEFLQDPEHFTVLQTQTLEKMASVLDKHKASLTRQIKGNPTLLKLLMKASQEKLTNEEKQKVQQGLTEAIKAIPGAMLQAIPKTLLTYPVLMQIIPEGVVVQKPKPQRSI